MKNHRGHHRLARRATLGLVTLGRRIENAPVYKLLSKKSDWVNRINTRAHVAVNTNYSEIESVFTQCYDQLLHNFDYKYIVVWQSLWLYDNFTRA